MSAHRRGPWSNAEDAYLMSLVQTHGPLNWVRIAQTLGSRTPKQCRERYHQNLKPTLNHDPITADEGAKIEQLVEELGKRWAEIARRLDGRSDNAVKNWWNGSQNRRKRLDHRRRAMPAATSPRAAYYVHPLTMVPPPLPRLRSPSGSRQLHHWIDQPLPSPCSSESAESDVSSNYTTSPRRHSLSLNHNVELPPIRNTHNFILAEAHPYSHMQLHTPRDPRLPRLSDLVPTLHEDGNQSRSRLPPMGMGFQLPTAPSSPTTQQQKSPAGGSDKDSRMNLSTLLE